MLSIITLLCLSVGLMAIIQLMTIISLRSRLRATTEHNIFLQNFIDHAVETVNSREAEQAFEKGWKARVN